MINVEICPRSWVPRYVYTVQFIIRTLWSNIIASSLGCCVGRGLDIPLPCWWLRLVRSTQFFFAATSAWLGCSSVLGCLRVRSGSRLVADPELRADVEEIGCSLLIVVQGCRPTLGDGDVLRNAALFPEDKAAASEGAKLCEYREGPCRKSSTRKVVSLPGRDWRSLSLFSLSALSRHEGGLSTEQTARFGDWCHVPVSGKNSARREAIAASGPNGRLFVWSCSVFADCCSGRVSRVQTDVGSVYLVPCRLWMALCVCASVT